MSRLRRLRLWHYLLIGIILLALVFVGGPFVYIHFIEGPAPKPLSLPTRGDKSTKTAGATPFPTGTWRATSASVVGYRVNEVLFGQNNVAVGRTHSVTGSITLSGTTVSKGQFVVQMSTVHSDESQRDAQFDGRIMSVSQFPTATFTLTSPIDLGILRAGQKATTTATGNLTLRGQANIVTFTVDAEFTKGAIDVSGSIPILFSTWDIPNPGFGNAITTDNHGILEFLLVLHQGTAT
jgi:polyisoprenoid-binding protein YceI